MSLVFEMEWMEICASHPNNQYDKAHQSGIGKIVLLNAILNQGLLINGDKEIPLSKSMEIKDFEILDFNETFRDSGFELSLFGCNVSEPAVDFIKMNINYSTSHVMFNELCEISWFETI